jgi:Protein of unknown function (DUF3501)
VSTALSPADILDLRAYERVRDDYRRRVMARKRRRRVPLGPIATVVFECVDTVRFQVQEMARAERIATDEGIQHELDVYNRLLPVPGELSATLFVELTSEADLRHWLPRLVGIERSVAVEVGTAGEGPLAVVVSEPEASHAESLTRESVTPAVHYLRFPFDDAARRRFAHEPVALAVHHPEYEARSPLDQTMHAELLGDLEGTTRPLPLA